MKTTHIIAIITSLFILCISVYQCHRNSLKTQIIAQYEQNLKAAQDTIHYYELKNGEHAAAQQAWLLTEKEMLKQLKMSKDELADIKSQIGKPTTITKLVTTTKVDTITMTKTVPVYINTEPIQSGRIEVPFNYIDKWLTLSGQTNVLPDTAQTTLYKLEMLTPLTIGMTADNKFFATTPNPYVKFKDINSVQIESYKPKKAHWGFGINVGPGLYYDFINSKVGAGIGMQVGLNYNF